MKFSKLTKPELEEILKNANFTDEEAEVFKLLVADKSLEEVSQRLLISKTTTSRRVATIKEKIETIRHMRDLSICRIMGKEQKTYEL